MSEGLKQPRFQFSLRTIFVCLTAIALLLGLVITGAQWLVGQVREGEREWRRTAIREGRFSGFDESQIDSVLGDWFDDGERQSLKDEHRRRKAENLISD
jgi:hypothetical protein